MKRSILAVLVVALVGCGNPAPSTPIAPDLPVTNTTQSGTSPNLNQMKQAEHGGAAQDRQSTP